MISATLLGAFLVAWLAIQPNGRWFAAIAALAIAALIVGLYGVL